MNFRKWIGPGIGVGILLTFLILPPIEPLTAFGMKILGIFSCTVIWWITVGIGYPSFLCLALLAATGAMTSEDVFAASMGNWLVFFIIAVMGLSGGLRHSGFSRRFAVWFMSLPFTKGRPWMLITMLLFACSLMGMVMSLTANCIIFMAIVAPMLEEMGYKKGDKFAATVMMGIAWASTASFIMTPIASLGNLLAIGWMQRDLNYTVTFPQWFLWGIPMGILVFLILLFVYRFIVRPDVKKFAEMGSQYVAKAKKEMGAIRPEEKIAAGIFLLVIICWLLPDMVKTFLPNVSEYLITIGRAVPALIGACFLCLIKVKSKPVLRFEQWMRDYTEWGTVALVAAIAIMGGLIGDPQTGIPQLLTSIFQPMATSLPFFAFLLLALAWVTIQTNAMSNFVSMTLVYTIMVPIASAAGLGNPVALGVEIS
ncbi:MAG: SLC13 family permease, partial [Dehalococcoidales bacterium]|nr:SLC13 family permease [Dehalococcoidales bacterium]